MALSTSEMKVQNEVPVPEPARILDISWQVKQRITRRTARFTQLFKLCCNVFYEPAEWFIC